jgi:hypothetical protein
MSVHRCFVQLERSETLEKQYLRGSAGHYRENESLSGSARKKIVENLAQLTARVRRAGDMPETQLRENERSKVAYREHHPSPPFSLLLFPLWMACLLLMTGRGDVYDSARNFVLRDIQAKP